MEVKIYQIKRENIEKCGYMFFGYDFAERHGLTLDDYDCVYTMELQDVENLSKATILNMVYHKFNIERPEDFKGHSLSVSDIIGLDDELYYCDDIGWEKLK